MEVDKIRPLAELVEGYWNTFRYRTCVAVRFRKPVLWCPSKGSSTVCRFENDGHYVFSTNVQFALPDGTIASVTVKDREKELLLRLLPRHVFRSTFFDDTLFAMTTGTFRQYRDWEKVRRNVSFHALCALGRTEEAAPLDYRQCSAVRLFRRNRRTWKKWYSWYPFVYEMTRDRFYARVGSFPGTTTALWLHRVLNRSARPLPTPNVPVAFYACELLSDDALPVGVLYQTAAETVQYVSPMVVAFQNRTFLDVNGRTCDGWMPLFRNRETWLASGLNTCCSHLVLYRRALKGILRWLSGASADKYAWMREDLNIVQSILL